MIGNPRFLYRGIDERSYELYEGGLQPKHSGPFEYIFKADGTMRADASAIGGPSEQNAILRHELRQEGFGSCGISTTPHFARARHYATKCNGSGRVLKIERMLLEAYRVREYIVSECIPYPSIPEDEEVILVADDYGVLPREIVVEQIRVEAPKREEP